MNTVRKKKQASSYCAKTDRVRRACDKCNSSRTRCSGELPCRRCLDLNYLCQYDRTVKKRGPKPRSYRNNCTSSSRYGKTQDNQAMTDSGSSDCSNECITPQIPDFPTALSLQTSGIRWEDNTGDILESPAPSDFPDTSYLPGNMADFHVSKSYLSGKSPGFIPGSPFPGDLVNLNTNHDNEILFVGCRYPCLYPILAELQGVLSPSEACDLLDVYFTDPEGSVMSAHCPYVLCPVIRKKSLLCPTNPRPVSAALLAIILWAVSQTAGLEVFQCPGARNRISLRLYSLAMTLLRERESNRFRFAPGGLRYENNLSFQPESLDPESNTRTYNATSTPNVDDVLSYVLLTCVISGSEFKAESLKWWNKAVLLLKQLGYHSEAKISENTLPSQQMSLASREEHEECRRVFWLVYALDRHIALSFNEPLRICDSECQVLAPLPEWAWQNLDTIPLEEIPSRVYGPFTHISGTGFLDYFLPLMAILGDIIDFRFRNQHPRLGGFDDAHSMSAIEANLAECEYSLEVFRAASEKPPDIPSSPASTPTADQATQDPISAEDARRAYTTEHRVQLVIAYSHYMIRVLHILLHGKWDAISILEDSGSWITSPSFLSCTSNSIAAGQAISHILDVDNNLSFIPFVFGIYLFHGSLTFLLFADRMAQVGPNVSVRQACEVIIRAHEISVVTFDTEFQKLLSGFAIYVIQCPESGLGGLGVEDANKKSAFYV